MAESVKIGVLILPTRMIGTTCPPTTVVTQTPLVQTNRGVILPTPMCDGNLVTFQYAQAPHTTTLRGRAAQMGFSLAPRSSPRPILLLPVQSTAILTQVGLVAPVLTLV